MAEGLLDSSILGGLDPESLNQLKGLLAQFAPTEDEKKQARMQSILNFGLGLLGARKGMELPTIGAAAMNSANSYNADLKALSQQRGANITQAAQLLPIIQEMQWQKELRGAGSPTAQTQMMGPPDPSGAMQQQLAANAYQPSGNTTLDYARTLGVPEVVIRNSSRKDLMKIISDYAKPENQRAGGSQVRNDQFGRPYIAITSPILGEGKQMVNGQVGEIPNYSNVQKGLTQSHEAAQQSAKLSFEPAQPRVDETGQQIQPSGSRLEQMYPQGKLPYGAPSPFQGQPSAGDLANMRAMDQSGRGFDWTASGGLQPKGNVTKIAPGLEKELTGRGDALAEQAKEIDARAQVSQAAYARNQEMRALVNQFTPGVTAPFRRSVASWAEGLGAPQGIVTSIAGGDLAAMQALQKQVVNAAFEATKQLTARPAQAEVIMSATKGTANEAMSKPAFIAILDYNDGIHHYLTDMQTAKDAWIKDNGGSLAGFQASWNKAHPLEAYIPSVEDLKRTFSGGAPQVTNAGAGNSTLATILRSNPTPTQLEELRRKGYIQ